MKPVIHTENEPEVVSRIAELLIKQGKTQTELLEYLGLHRNNFTEWKADVRDRICYILMKSRDILMFRQPIFFEVKKTMTR